MSRASSRAQILKKATEYIQFIRRKNSTHQEDIEDLKRQNSLLEQQIKTLERAQSKGIGNGAGLCVGHFSRHVQAVRSKLFEMIFEMIFIFVLFYRIAKSAPKAAECDGRK